jgi:hypothetical protein
MISGRESVSTNKYSCIKEVIKPVQKQKISLNQKMIWKQDFEFV